MNPTKARLNEINFLELCTRIISIRQKPYDIKLYIGYLGGLLDFDIEIISSIAEKIFTPEFYVNINELFTLLENNLISSEELSKMLGRSIRTIYRYKDKGKDTVLYPRLNPEEQIALDKFMEQHDKFFIRNYKNIFNELGGK